MTKGEKPRCVDCKHYKVLKAGVRGGAGKGSCVLRNTESYKDLRYGNSPSCKKHFKRKGAE